MSISFDLFLARLVANCARFGDKTLFSFVDDQGKVKQSVSYKEFDEQTQNLGRYLLHAVNNSENNGNRNVLLVYPPGLDFIIAFVSCLRAGLVPVPVYPPHPSRKKDIMHFISIQTSCQANMALTNSEYNYFKKISGIKNFITNRSVNKAWPELIWVTTNNVSTFNDPTLKLPQVNENDLAFLQYTSGSTAEPKGVMLTHKNISHNLSCIERSLVANDDTVVVSWLPQYHDMGLIGAYLGAIYVGGSGIYMSPFSFIKSPILWLKLISRYRATHIQAPNFAYKLIVRKFPVGFKEELNFSSLRHIFNAAEPIDVKAMEDFVSTFAKYGMTRDKFSPGYGLAENTVYVCDGGKLAITIDKKELETNGRVKLSAPEVKDHNSMTLQGCGNPMKRKENNIHVKIVKYAPEFESDKNKTPIYHAFTQEDRVGEIWVASPSKSIGYFGLPELSKEMLHAKLKINHDAAVELGGDEMFIDERREWLRTGDLGFIHEGELFICGRIKDLIIVRGRNHYPQDIEYTIGSGHSFAEHIKPGCSAAFQVDENLVVVAEVRASSVAAKLDLRAMCEEIMKAILGDHEVSVNTVVLIEEHSINKTTSGKIKRHGVKKDFQQGALKEVFRFVNSKSEAEQAAANVGDSESPPVPVEKSTSTDAASIQAELHQETARLIMKDISEIPLDRNLIELGMDSIAITQLKGMITNKYEVELEDELLFNENTTLATISKAISDVKAGKTPELPPALPATANIPKPQLNQATGPDFKLFWCC